MSLVWRLFGPNALVLTAASIFLIVAPPNGRVPIILGGLAVMLGVNLALIRWAWRPLERLAATMQRVDPLSPGRRVPVGGPRSEVSMLAERFNEMLERLERERRESAGRALAAEEAERRRIASDLHDEVGQALTALVLELQRAAAESPSSVGTPLSAVAGRVEAIIDDVRAVARHLRPEALDDLGLAAALVALCEHWSDVAGLRVERDISRELPPLSSTCELVIYRFVQEALTNVARHAQASRVRVRLYRDGADVCAEVADDGVGFPPHAADGGGLRGMRERALLVDGAITVGEGELGGFCVELRFRAAALAHGAPQQTGGALYGSTSPRRIA